MDAIRKERIFFMRIPDVCRNCKNRFICISKPGFCRGFMVRDPSLIKIVHRGHTEPDENYDAFETVKVILKVNGSSYEIEAIPIKDKLMIDKIKTSTEELELNMGRSMFSKGSVASSAP